MKNMIRNMRSSRDVMLCMILILFAALLMAFLCRGLFLYGSDTDWISQHSVLPEYFRQRFYQTGNFFPDFAMNLGGGQNIYYFSYYGLFNPIILISYLLPGVSMPAYVMASSIAVVFLSVCLCFRWLKNNGFSSQITFIAAFCFLCAGPLIFQSHRQIPFIDYFPFLLLGLLSIDRYFKTHRKWHFILCVFLCILTSYFFSVGCILVLLIYAGYKQIKQSPKCSFRKLLRGIFPLIRGVVIAVFMAAILWLPTLYVILAGKEGANGDPIPFFSLIIPPVWAVLYSPYTVGLSVIVLAALFLIVFRTKEFGCEKHEQFLAVILLLLLASPLFLYLLNGTLYVRAKALIPFLPLYVLILAIFLTRFTGFMLRREKIAPQKRRLLVWALFIFLLCDSGLNCVRANFADQLVPTQEYADVYNPDKIALIQEVQQGDHGFYRMLDLTNSNITCNQVYGSGYNTTSLYSSTCNKGFNKFYYDVLHNPIATRNRMDCASSNNIFSLNYFNVKYIVTNESAPSGYQKVNEKGDYTLYQNDHSLPFAFAADHTMSQKDFDAIPFPYNMGPLFENIIVDKKSGSLSTDKTPSGFAIRKIDLRSAHLKIENPKNIAIKKVDGHFYVHAKDAAIKNPGLKENSSLDIPLDINLKDNILIVSFQMSNKDDQANEDAFITINGVKNKLSKKSAAYPNDNTDFIYVLSSTENTKRLKVEFSPGTYEAYHFKAYTIPAAAVAEMVEKKDPFVVDTAKTGADLITGNIHVGRNGYFATTLPYDNGFAITVDGKTQNYEKANTAFVGFPIEKGTHHIVIRYHAPFKQTGMVLSLIGFLLFVISCAAERKKRSICNEEYADISDRR